MNPLSPDTKILYQAILKLKNLAETKAFFRDLLTPQEIDTFSSRFKVVRLLHQGKPYQEIARLAKTSTTTVTRVAYWLHRGGYRLILNRLFPNKR